MPGRVFFPFFEPIFLLRFFPLPQARIGIDEFLLISYDDLFKLINMILNIEHYYPCVSTIFISIYGHNKRSSK